MKQGERDSGPMGREMSGTSQVRTSLWLGRGAVKRSADFRSLEQLGGGDMCEAPSLRRARASRAGAYLIANRLFFPTQNTLLRRVGRCCHGTCGTLKMSRRTYFRAGAAYTQYFFPVDTATHR